MKEHKILIADDMQSMRSLLKSILVKAGFVDLTEVDNGRSAMDMIQETKFDLVICDWDMPHMTGIQVLESIRADDDLYKTPFIMVSANADREKVNSAIESGTDGYVIKPLQPDTLLKIVAKLLSIPGDLAATA
ncbi:MAG: response regulator [Gammaproteobacteria bacterium]|nr:response regulator [Gammaproteobacteria bacterium]